MSATETGALLSAISRANARRRQQVAARNNLANEAAAQRLIRIENPSGKTPFRRLRRPDDTGKNQLEAAFITIPRRAKTKPERALRGNPYIHRQQHGGADADRRPIDRADHGLEALEYAERDAAAAVARATSE